MKNLNSAPRTGEGIRLELPASPNDAHQIKTPGSDRAHKGLNLENSLRAKRQKAKTRRPSFVKKPDAYRRAIRTTRAMTAEEITTALCEIYAGLSCTATTGGWCSLPTDDLDDHITFASQSGVCGSGSFRQMDVRDTGFSYVLRPPALGVVATLTEINEQSTESDLRRFTMLAIEKYMGAAEELARTFPTAADVRYATITTFKKGSRDECE